MRRFGTSKRPDIANKIETPGPGTYRPPSDFGYLDFKPKSQYAAMRIKENHSTLAQSVKTKDIEHGIQINLIVYFKEIKKYF